MGTTVDPFAICETQQEGQRRSELRVGLADVLGSMTLNGLPITVQGSNINVPFEKPTVVPTFTLIEPAPVVPAPIAFPPKVEERISEPLTPKVSETHHWTPPAAEGLSVKAHSEPGLQGSQVSHSTNTSHHYDTPSQKAEKAQAAQEAKGVLQWFSQLLNTNFAKSTLGNVLVPFRAQKQGNTVYGNMLVSGLTTQANVEEATVFNFTTPAHPFQILDVSTNGQLAIKVNPGKLFSDFSTEVTVASLEDSLNASAGQVVYLACNILSEDDPVLDTVSLVCGEPWDDYPNPITILGEDPGHQTVFNVLIAELASIDDPREGIPVGVAETKAKVIQHLRNDLIATQWAVNGILCCVPQPL